MGDVYKSEKDKTIKEKENHYERIIVNKKMMMTMFYIPHWKWG